MWPLQFNPIPLIVFSEAASPFQMVPVDSFPGANMQMSINIGGSASLDPSQPPGLINCCLGAVQRVHLNMCRPLTRWTNARTQSYTETRRGTHACRHVLLVLTSTLGLSGWRDKPVNHQITESLLAAGSLRRSKDSYKSKIKINLSYPRDGWRMVERPQCSERERRQSGLQGERFIFKKTGFSFCLFGWLSRDLLLRVAFTTRC